jgi:fatty acyl-CoA reductase
MLVQDVNIVFHAAATVRFDEELRKAFYINVLGVKGMLDLAREMLHLKVRNIRFLTL